MWGRTLLLFGLVFLINALLFWGVSSSVFAEPTVIESIDPSSIQKFFSTPWYSVDFTNLSGGDFVVFSAKDSTLKFKPAGMRFDDSSLVLPVFNPESNPSDRRIRYGKVFGDGIDFEYELLNDTLKEKIIISSKQALSVSSPQSNLLLIDFILEYSNNTIISLDSVKEWDGKPVTTGEPLQFIRKKKPLTLYVVNEYYRILSPHAVDNKGNLLNLTYKLQEVGDKTHLSLITPLQWLNEAKYPVTLDPTIEFTDEGNYIEWENQDDCSSDTNDCTGIDSSGEGCEGHSEDPCFIIWSGCSVTPPDSDAEVEKPLFRFNITKLYDYTGTLHSATLRSEGQCYNKQYLADGYTIKLYQIDEFTSTPSCDDNPDQAVGSSLRNLMTDSSCPGDDVEYTDITSRLDTSLDNTDSYIAFKVDVSPTYPYNEDPSFSPKFRLYDTDLELHYTFTCDDSEDCLGGEFCNKSGLCTEQLSNGGNCNNVEFDNQNNEACSNGICAADLDGDDYYCTDSTHCVNGGLLYDQGYELCNGESWYKTCSGSAWVSQQNCPYGCESGVNGSCVTKWWPSWWNSLNETNRTNSTIEFVQYIRWNDLHLSALDSFNAHFQYEIRRPDEPDVWDAVYPNSINCSALIYTDLPDATTMWSEESNLSSQNINRWCRYWATKLGVGNEEFEVKVRDVPGLVADHTYTIQTKFSRRNPGQLINVTLKAEYCGKIPGICFNGLTYTYGYKELGKYEITS